jgi:hypothetical protein
MGVVVDPARVFTSSFTVVGCSARRSAASEAP